MAENKMDIDKACEIISNMRWEEDMPGVYTHSERENTALWMAYRALEFCKKNGFADYNDFVECGEEAENELKPCPFCGNNDIRRDMVPTNILHEKQVGIVYCIQCGAQVRYYRSIDGAIKIWNRRANDGRE